MRRALIAALVIAGAAFPFLAHAQERALVKNVAFGAAGSGSEAVWPGSTGTDSTDVSNAKGGIFYAVVTCADSVKADSVAFEVFPYVGLKRALGGFRLWAPFDNNNSNGAKLDGWFCTTLDSTALSTPGNLSPTSVTGPHYPYRVSSVVIPGQYLMPSGSMALPQGEMAGQFGWGTTDSVDRTRRVFVMPFNDGFGGTLDGAVRMSAAVVNRHPRIGYTIDLYYVAGK